MTVNEATFRALSTKIVMKWHGKRWLDLIALHFSSRQNWQILLDINALR
jgi:hypothetical protein